MAWAPDYATSAELAAYVRIGDSADDVQLALAVAAASRAVDRSTHRQFGLVAAPEGRLFAAEWDAGARWWVVPMDDLMTVEGLAVAVDVDDAGAGGMAVTGYQLAPLNAQLTGRPWEQLLIGHAASGRPSQTARVRVTARFGWSGVPPTVKQATLLQASRLLARRDAPFGVAGSPEAGSELRLLAKVDPDVAVILSEYRRRWLGV